MTVFYGRRNSLLLVALLAFLALQFSACGGDTNAASTEKSYQSVTVQNCEHTLTFTKAPTRILSTYQTTTDILLKLGLGQHIVGIYYGQLYQKEPAFEQDYKRLHNLGGDMMSSVPSKEVVLSQKPDFVFSAYPAGDFLASYGMATQEQLQAQGAQVYGLSGECTTDTTKANVSDLYTDILNIGKIFQVEARAQQLVSTMQARIDAVHKRVRSLAPVPVVAIPMSANPGANGTIPVIGAGIYTDVLRLAGAKNLFGTQGKTYPTISKEHFAAQQTEAYVLVHYQGIDPQKITSYLFSTFPNTPAAHKQRVLVIESNHWNAGIFLPDTIEQLAKTLHPEVFA